MKTSTHYKKTNELLKFISDNWPNLSVGEVKLILEDARHLLTMEYSVSVIRDADGEERDDMTVTVKDLNLD